MLRTTKLDLFAGIPVTSYADGRVWYEQLLGSPPTFLPHGTEAVWELAPHRYLYIVEDPAHAGHARLTIFVGDLDTFVAGIAERGLRSTTRESYPNGVHKISYRDPDGNEIGLGGSPKRRAHRPSQKRKGRA